MNVLLNNPEVRRPAKGGTSAPFDVQRIRADFPILRQEINGKPLVYLDNAATSQKPQAVLDAIARYYEADNANVHRAVHQLSERATVAYEAARVTVQKFIGAHCLREIVFTRGTTESINLVAQSFGRLHVHPGDEIVISWLEHHSNIVPWQMLCEEKGAHLRVLPVNDNGELRLEELERLITPRTRLVALAHVSNALGTINPVRKVIEAAHRRGVPVLLDGAQAVPHLPVNVQELDCDFYAFSGHKVYGPTGIGVLYGKAMHLEMMPPWQGGGDMIRTVSFEKTTYNELPYKFEAGTPNMAGAIGLAAALDYVEGLGRANIAAHEQQLGRYAAECLADIPGVRLIGTAADKAAVISFVVEDPPLSALDIGTRLDLEGIAIRTGHHCCMPLMERYGIPGTARASFAVYNTMEEVEAFALAMKNLVAEAQARGRPGAQSARANTVSSARAESAERGEIEFPGPSAASPTVAGEELVELFDFFDDWTDRYRQIMEMGEKLPIMPAELKVEANRVHGCQSTAYLWCRLRPDHPGVIEFLADSDADIVRGLVAILEKVFSGQSAAEVAAFDVPSFFRRLGLDQNLSMGRRNGLGDMVRLIQGFAAKQIRA